MQNKTGMSRRDFLKALAAGSAGAAVAAAGVPIVSAAEHAAAPRAQGGEVVLQTAGWPYEVVPDAEPEGGWTPYQQALMAWMEQNPNVRLERIEAGIWDTGALLTAIAGGTAPAYFHAGVIGNWNAAGQQSAFIQGLLADMTAQWESFDLPSKMSQGVLNGAAFYTANGSIIGLPNELIPGNGIFYRKDLFAEAGIEEPNFESSWADVREMAKALTTGERKGIATQSWGLGSWWLGSEGVGDSNLFSLIPDPSSGWNWKWDFSSNPDLFVNPIQLFREMMFEDQSVLTDGTFGDGQIYDQFLNGNVAMVTVPLQFYWRVDEASAYSMAKRMEVPLSELVGTIPHPLGTNGHYNAGSRPIVGVVGLSPDLTEDQKNAATNLYIYMDIEEGFDLQRRIAFENTGDLAQVFTPYPFFHNKTSVEGVEGSPADAWGQGYIDTINHIAAATNGYPERGLFFPSEENLGPTNSAWNDAANRLQFEAGDLDILSILKAAEDTYNQQAAGFSSSVSDEEFIAGATAYYQAHNDFWSANFPEFYENTFKPWYDSVIAPALGL